MNNLIPYLLVITIQPRNLCALKWVKNNLQGTTDKVKIYYDNLFKEQKQVWLCLDMLLHALILCVLKCDIVYVGSNV